MTPINPKDLERINEDFYRRGINVVEWARDHGVQPRAVYNLLSGRSKALRGDSHRVALILGLKTEAGSSVEQHEPKTANSHAEESPL